MPFNPIPGTSEPERIDGTVHRDLVHAGGGNDTVAGWARSDRMFGEGGNDLIFGDYGDDTLYGGAGHDELHASTYENGDTGYMYGGSGNDSIFAEDVTDYSFGGIGDDQVTIYFDLGGEAHGGAGTDTLVMNYIGSGVGTGPGHTDVTVTLAGGGAGAVAGAQSMALSGFERIEITTWDGDDFIIAGGLADRINVFEGANTVAALGGDDWVSYRAAEVNLLDGGSGNDTLQVVQLLDEALVLTVAGNVASDGYGSLLSNFEFWDVYSSAGDDEIALGQGSDHLHARDGMDRGWGKGGRDFLFGGGGEDSLYGGAGNDLIGGGSGLDRLTGGAGADTFRFGSVSGLGDTVSDMEHGVDHVEITAAATGNVLAVGAVDAARFSVGLAIGAGGQFVLGPGVAAGQSRLVWDANGSDEGGTVLIAVFEGQPALDASDLLII